MRVHPPSFGFHKNVSSVFPIACFSKGEAIIITSSYLNNKKYIKAEKAVKKRG